MKLTYVEPATGEVVELTEVEYNAKMYATLELWEKAKKQLDAAKEAELELRKLYVAMATNPQKEKGTEDVPLQNGWKAKVVKKVNTSFRKGDDGKTDWDAVHDTQDQIEKLGNEGAFIADRILKWEAKFSLTEYNNLDASNPTHAAIKRLIDGIIVSTPGAPTLTLVEPKG